MNVDWRKSKFIGSVRDSMRTDAECSTSNAPEPQAAVASSTAGTATGVVFDEAGDPLIGVSVSIEGKGAVGVTDLDGRFSVKEAKPGQTLKFTYVGLAPETVKVPADGQPVTVVLKGGLQAAFRSCRYRSRYQACHQVSYLQCAGGESL